jgi:hypothetical protein
MEKEQVEEEMNLGDKEMVRIDEIWFITCVRKCQILANIQLTMMSKCKINELELTILKNRGLLFYADIQSFVHIVNIVKFCWIS